MYVCLCHAVNERRIEQAVREGVVHLRDLCRQHGVGSRCGKCVPQARMVLDRSLQAAVAEAEPLALGAS